MKLSTSHTVAVLAAVASVASARPATFSAEGGVTARGASMTTTGETGTHASVSAHGAARRQRVNYMCRNVDGPLFFSDVFKAFKDGWRMIEQGYVNSAGGAKQGNSTSSGSSTGSEQPGHTNSSSSPPSSPPSSLPPSSSSLPGKEYGNGTHSKSSHGSGKPASTTSSSVQPSDSGNSTTETASSTSGTPSGKSKSESIDVKAEVDITTKKSSKASSTSTPPTSHAGSSLNSRSLTLRSEHKWTFWDELGLAFQTTACLIGHSLGFSPAVQVVAEAGAKIKKS